MPLYSYKMRTDTYIGNGLYYNTRPSINDSVNNPIVYNNSDPDKWVMIQGFKVYNSACFIAQNYDQRYYASFCFVSEGQGHIVRFENNNAYYDSHNYDHTDGHGLYTNTYDSSTGTYGGVTVPRNDFFSAWDKTDLVIDPNLPTFYDVNEYLAYITNPAQPPYNWQSVPSISGKNGILQFMSTIVDMNDGDPITTSDATKFTLVEESNVGVITEDIDDSIKPGADAGGISGSGSNSGNQSTGYAFGQGESGTNKSGGGSGLYGGYKSTV